VVAVPRPDFSGVHVLLLSRHGELFLFFSIDLVISHVTVSLIIDRKSSSRLESKVL
jgi:hypothetical protein